MFVHIFQDRFLKKEKIPQLILKNTEYHFIFYFFIIVNKYVSE